MADIEIRHQISKLDADRQLVFGWANVFLKADGTPEEDSEGDVIDTDDLIEDFEDAAYEYVLEVREGDVMHKKFGVARLVESMMFTDEKVAALELPDDIPRGWWVGYKVDDPDVWKRVRDGELTMFSIVGFGEREEYEDAET